jgi:radical SAM enzyme (TIGR01210 family)
MILDIRNKAKVKKYNPRSYISSWIEKDVVDGKVVDALVIILRTRGCSWALSSGCSMCGYINDCDRDPISYEDILYQFGQAIDIFANSGHEIVKIFTSGSFLDDNEISQDAQFEIISRIDDDNIKKLIIESRPEFIKPDKLDEISSIYNNIEIAIGLESANDLILKYSINKGFKFKNYLTAANIINDSGLSLKTYLLLKPPFLTEKESIIDAVESVKKISENGLGGTISFNPVHIQNYTLVERLWHRQEYRPPWLWSVVEVIKRAKPLINARLISAPTAGGKSRGPHNCQDCDAKVLQAINDFSLTNNIKVLDNLNCDCKLKWSDIIELEGFSKSGGYPLTR